SVNVRGGRGARSAQDLARLESGALESPAGADRRQLPVRWYGRHARIDARHATGEMEDRAVGRTRGQIAWMRGGVTQPIGERTARCGPYQSLTRDLRAPRAGCSSTGESYGLGNPRLLGGASRAHQHRGE